MPLKYKFGFIIFSLLAFLLIASQFKFNLNKSSARNIASLIEEGISLKRLSLQQDSDFISRKTFKRGKSNGPFSIEIIESSKTDSEIVYQVSIEFNENSDNVVWKAENNEGVFESVSAGDIKTLTFKFPLEKKLENTFFEVYKLKSETKFGSTAVFKYLALPRVKLEGNKPLGSDAKIKIFQ